MRSYECDGDDAGGDDDDDDDDGYESHDFPTCSKYKPKAFTSKPGQWGGCVCAEVDTRAWIFDSI